MLKMYHVSRNSLLEVFIKRTLLKKSIDLQGKQLCWSLYLIKFQTRDLQLYLKRDSGPGGAFKNTYVVENQRMAAFVLQVSLITPTSIWINKQ